MGHLVRYSSPEGEQRYEDVADLDTAVERVEHLRNAGGVSDVRVYREVPLEFRTYVRVAVADEEGEPSSPRSGSATGSAGGSSGGSTSSGSGSGSSSAAAPSGAAVISPAPASAASSSEAEERAREAEASAVQTDAEARSGDNRRISLFNRGQAS